MGPDGQREEGKKTERRGAGEMGYVGGLADLARAGGAKRLGPTRLGGLARVSSAFLFFLSETFFYFCF